MLNAPTALLICHVCTPRICSQSTYMTCAVKKVRKDTAANSTSVELNLTESVLANDSSNTLDSPFPLLNSFLFTFLLISPDCSLGEISPVEVTEISL